MVRQSLTWWPGDVSTAQVRGMVFMSLGSFSNDDEDVKNGALWKMDLYFTFEFRNSINVLRAPFCLTWLAQTELTIAVSSSPKYTGLGHFTLLFRRRQQRCTKTENARAKPMVHLLVLLFGDVLFDVTVVVS